MGGVFGGGDSKVKNEVNYPDWFDALYIPTLKELDKVRQAQLEQPVHPLAQMAYQGIAQQAMQGSPFVDQSMGWLQSMIGGQAPQMAPQQVPAAGNPAPRPGVRPPLPPIDWSGRIPIAQPNQPTPNRPQPQPQPQEPDLDPKVAEAKARAIARAKYQMGFDSVRGGMIK
jgi:hypothetical protein